MQKHAKAASTAPLDINHWTLLAVDIDEGDLYHYDPFHAKRYGDKHASHFKDVIKFLSQDSQLQNMPDKLKELDEWKVRDRCWPWPKQMDEDMNNCGLYVIIDALISAQGITLKAT